MILKLVCSVSGATVLLHAGLCVSVLKSGSVPVMSKYDVGMDVVDASLLS